MSVINNRDLFALAERALAMLAGGHIPIIELSYANDFKLVFGLYKVG